MKAKAPEKLYLSKNIYSTYLYQVPDPDDETAVEYVRTDAFIENAAEWIKNKAENYIIDTPLCYYFDYKRAVEDFKNYMKGE
jgi:hypothetical protein